LKSCAPSAVCRRRRFSFTLSRASHSVNPRLKTRCPLSLLTPPTRVLKEFRLDASDESTNVGDKILVDQFSDGDIVDVVGKSKGRGFAGTIKRHNFNRGPETHGSMNVRAPGSIGASAYPSRVVKGMRSSGHMGDVRVTIKRLRVARVDAENNLLMIRGAVPGANGSVVVVKKAARQAKK